MKKLIENFKLKIYNLAIMCGIFGYIGDKQALPIIVDGLKRLEYRGYDSAGVVVLNKKIFCLKSAGKIQSLEEKIKKSQNSERADIFSASLGIGHTRWATHGAPSLKNAHPHYDCEKSIAISHNGIIENYKFLKNKLIKNGHKFVSETDSEIIAHLIEEIQKEKNLPLRESVRLALKLVKGTYGLTVVSRKEPQQIIAAKNSSPLIIGVGKNENFVASDLGAILPHTREVVYLDNEEIAVITKSNFEIMDLNKLPKEKQSQTIEWSLEDASKEGSPYFMLKEIFEEPEVVKNSIRGRLIKKEGMAKLGGLEMIGDKLREIEKIIMVGCGSAYYAGLVGKYMLEEYAGVPAEVELASEFRYKKPILGKKTAVLAISQSGETADTLSAVREARQKGVLCLGLVNSVGSAIARETEAGIYNHAGPEIGVASTKAFISQITVLALLALFLGRQREMSLITGQRIAKELELIPGKIKTALKQNKKIKKIAEKFKSFKNFLYLGRKYNYPIALEGALKLKEITYIHAEGYSAGEMKHGPIAMIDKQFPTVAIVPKDSVYEKMISNLEEIKARGGEIIAVATQGKRGAEKITKNIIYIPKTLEMLTPILSIVPLQLFAYHMGVLKGLDVDKPRNLAKSVTVE